jgi:hypothetical protein
VAHQVDGAVNEYPPVIRVLALAEQLDAGLDANLGTALHQLRQLVVGQAVEDAERTKLLGAHQMPHPPGGRPARRRRAVRPKTR